MDRTLSEPLDLRRLAEHAQYSRFHFVRAFRAAYGETPGEYLRRRRIERACDLLPLANLTVREVGGVVGFSSLAAFSKRFKARVGVAPSEYRRRMVERGGPPPVPGYVLMWARRHPDRQRQQS
jgi:transcriptional regulator GlxA family with amidase domain